MIGLAGQYATVDELLTGRENLELVGLLYHLDKSSTGREHKRSPRANVTRQCRRSAGQDLLRWDEAPTRFGASLIGQPPVLLLDEPTTGLDPRTRNDLWGFIEELVAEGTTSC